MRSVEDVLKDELVVVGVLGHEADEHGGGVLASAVEVGRGPGGLLLLDVGLDLSAVEEPVLGGDLGDLGGLLEHLSPVGHDLDVGLELGELTAAGDGVGDHPDDVAEVLSHSQEVLSLHVVQDRLEICGDRLKIGHAALKLNAVVVAGEAHDETGGEVGHEGVHGGKRDAREVLSGGGFDGANREDHEVGEVGAGLEGLAGGPVALDGADVALDLTLVEEIVLADGCGELGGVLEDGSPLFDGRQVVSHALAGAESLGNLQDGEAELEDTLEVTVHAALLEVGDAGLNLGGHELTALEAGLDLSKVVFGGHAVDKAGEEVGSGHDANVGGSKHC
mmetsp:Transcript_31775/g.39518  ORF Transcript_31775/g.39518 Transcript_31775/m.39518 type:complete len:334 (+) Transcript_31775:153-1154(+)